MILIAAATSSLFAYSASSTSSDWLLPPPTSPGHREARLETIERSTMCASGQLISVEEAYGEGGQLAHITRIRSAHGPVSQVDLDRASAHVSAMVSPHASSVICEETVTTLRYHDRKRGDGVRTEAPTVRAILLTPDGVILR